MDRLLFWIFSFVTLTNPTSPTAIVNPFSKFVLAKFFMKSLIQNTPENSALIDFFLRDGNRFIPKLSSFNRDAAGLGEDVVSSF